MIKIENLEVVGWEHAIRGARNPMNSWEKSDSCTKGYVWCGEFCGNTDCHSEDGLVLGPNDHDLLMRLRNAGTDHRKFMRMITVYVDVTAPLYWWKEFDTYKVGTVANSCSTMHKIAAKEFTLEDFSTDRLMFDETRECLEETINILNKYRKSYIAVKKDEISDYDYTPKDYWWQMIQLLPSSYNQKRTVMLNYEVLANIYKSRKGHKLDEWVELCKWIETLPYSELIIGKENN